jgi:hypothetical protein
MKLGILVILVALGFFIFSAGTKRTGGTLTMVVVAIME